jgi:hypothetical protein
MRRRVLCQVAPLVSVGVAIRLGASSAIGHIAEAFLFKLRGHDPEVLGLATVMIVLVALATARHPMERVARLSRLTTPRLD